MVRLGSGLLFLAASSVPVLAAPPMPRGAPDNKAISLDGLLQVHAFALYQVALHLGLPEDDAKDVLDKATALWQSIKEDCTSSFEKIARDQDFKAAYYGILEIASSWEALKDIPEDLKQKLVTAWNRIAQITEPRCVSAIETQLRLESGRLHEISGGLMHRSVPMTGTNWQCSMDQPGLEPQDCIIAFGKLYDSHNDLENGKMAIPGNTCEEVVYGTCHASLCTSTPETQEVDVRDAAMRLMNPLQLFCVVNQKGGTWHEVDDDSVVIKVQKHTE